MGPFYHDGKGGRSSLFWEAYCVNKRGITLDIETGQGQQLLRELASDAHIVIESFAPGYLADRGLGYEELSRLNPGLVMTSITPFGQTGPYSWYQATDLVAWSMGGMQYVCGDADRPPLRINERFVYYLDCGATTVTAAALEGDIQRAGVQPE